MFDLKSILGMRSNVSALVYENLLGMRLCVGGFYYADGEIYKTDSIEYKLTDQFSEFHWKANNLELIK